jgi:hypothetical protein
MLERITDKIKEYPEITFGLIIVLLIIIFGLAIALAVSKCDNTATATKKKLNKWPDYEKDNPFSIQLRGTNYCLQPKTKADSLITENGSNLILNEGCDENRYKYKVLPEGQIQQFKHVDSKTDKIIGGNCLHPKIGTNKAEAKENEEIVFNNNCNDSWPDNMTHTLRYTYENGKIKNNKTGLCLKADTKSNGSIIRLVKNCDDASEFDLI